MTGRRTMLSLFAASALVLSSAATAAAADPLATYRWKSRVLLIVAPSRDHPLVVAQRAALAEKRSDIVERDLVVFEAVDDSTAARMMRTRFKLDENDARVILIGKDGGDKLTESKVIPAQTLFREIDAMPMRKDEMRKPQR